MSIDGIPIHLVDTAGIRETEDQIEQMGIEKTKEAFYDADLALLVIDGSKKLDKEDRILLEMAKEKNTIVLLNKKDLGQKIIKKEIKTGGPQLKIIETSLTKGEGIVELEKIIKEIVYAGEVYQKDSLMITNSRHERLLKEAEKSLGDGINLIKIMEPLEFIEIDVKRAYDFLGEIIGETVSEDIINEVFERFCLGK